MQYFHWLELDQDVQYAAQIEHNLLFINEI